MSKEQDRFARRAKPIPREVLQLTSVSVIGVGAVGRQIALLLAALGVRQMQLVDPSCVRFANIENQGYALADIGELKVNAVAAAVANIDPLIAVDPIADRCHSKMTVGDAVFCCVDTTAARRAIWQAAGRHCHYWCEGRVTGEVVRVFTATNTKARRYYAKTHAKRERQANRPVAGPLYAASVAAALMVSQFSQWLRDLAIPRELRLDLSNNHLQIL